MSTLAADGSLLTGLNAAVGIAPALSPDAAAGGLTGQIPVRTGASDLQSLPAGTLAARALPGTDRLGILAEDWFEPSLPAEEPSRAKSSEPAEPQQAPIGMRFTAVVVDGALMLGVVLAATLAATLNLKELPGIKEMTLGAAALLVLFGLLYQILFATLGKATPGMKCAHVSLRTLEDEEPTRAQRCGRLLALFLSLLPAGLGVLWALFDRDHLSLHDRLSGTCLRKY